MIKTGERKTEGDFLLMKFLGKEFVAVNCCHNRVSTTHYLSGGYNYRVPTARCSRWWYCGACRECGGVPGGSVAPRRDPTLSLDGAVLRCLPRW